MAGHEPYDDPKLTGFKKYFNNYTIRGRANTSKATFLALGLFIIYKKFTKKKPVDPTFED